VVPWKCVMGAPPRRCEPDREGVAVATEAWDNVPITKTEAGVKIEIGAIYYYPHADDPESRRHGYVRAGKAKIPFEDEIDLLLGLAQVLRRATQGAAKYDRYRTGSTRSCRARHDNAVELLQASLGQGDQLHAWKPAVGGRTVTRRLNTGS
jgi:hypothetical protein